MLSVSHFFEDGFFKNRLPKKKKNLSLVLPQTYEDAMTWLDGRRRMLHSHQVLFVGTGVLIWTFL